MYLFAIDTLWLKLALSKANQRILENIVLSELKRRVVTGLMDAMGHYKLKQGLILTENEEETFMKTAIKYRCSLFGNGCFKKLIIQANNFPDFGLEKSMNWSINGTLYFFLIACSFLFYNKIGMRILKFYDSPNFLNK